MNNAEGGQRVAPADEVIGADVEEEEENEKEN
jgi:hypothetical protein